MKNKDKKKNGNGLHVLDGGDSPKEPAEILSRIELKDEDKKRLILAEQTLGQAKLFLANAHLLLMQAEQTRNEKAQDVIRLNEEYMALIRKLATENGIDVDADPAKVRWDLNTVEGVFSRLS